MTRKQLVQEVALRMDEVTPPDFEVTDLSVDGSDGNPLYSLIDGLVDSGALELFSVAPYWRLKQSPFTGKKLDSAGYARTLNDGHGGTAVRQMIRLKVPDDFLRVAEISHPSFQRPITEVVPEASEQGRRQHNPYLMAKEARPVGVMSHGTWTTTSGQDTVTEQCREIDCYSIPSSANLEDLAATYIPRPATISTVEDSVPAVLIPALEWIIAARAFGARGDSNHAAICQQNAQNLLV